MTALDLDRNGACLVVHPDVPLLDVPNATAIAVVWFILLGKLARATGLGVGYQTLDAKRAAVATLGMIMVASFVTKFFLGCIF